MGRFWKLSFAFFCCFMLCGCGSKAAPPRLVTKVSVTDGAGTTRVYTQPKKMETILYYLRCLEPSGKVKTDPERIMGESYQICVEFSDGGKSIYRQRANRFLSRDSRPWQNVDPQKAALLQPLLEGIGQG